MFYYILIIFICIYLSPATSFITSVSKPAYSFSLKCVDSPLNTEALPMWLSSNYSSMPWTVSPIGYVISPYFHKIDTPKQATISRLEGGSVDGSIILFQEYLECLEELDKFDYIWLVTYMDKNKGYKNKIKPQPRDKTVANKLPPTVGLFASRSPHRPNNLALSALKISSVDFEKGIIKVKGIDMLNHTPVLDIKPYIPAFDSFPSARAGWMDLICGDAEDARANGYQNIHSARGARAARAKKRFEEATASTNSEVEVAAAYNNDDDHDL